jgi:hypothetical protein
METFPPGLRCELAFPDQCERCEGSKSTVASEATGEFWAMNLLLFKQRGGGLSNEIARLVSARFFDLALRVLRNVSNKWDLPVVVFQNPHTPQSRRTAQFDLSLG